jgi:hypothetical protein
MVAPKALVLYSRQEQAALELALLSSVAQNMKSILPSLTLKHSPATLTCEERICRDRPLLVANGLVQCKSARVRLRTPQRKHMAACVYN